MHGLLCGAKKFTHVAYLRRDPLVPEMLGIRRVASQSVRSRFFQGFSSAGRNLGCFRRLFGWCLERLPSLPGGYALDLDSTRLLHEDGHQEGVAVGYPRLGTKPCLHPLLAVLSEVRLVASFWLRAGNSSCANNVVGFFLDLWENLPRHLNLRVVRADSGFCVSELLRLWEQLRLKFIVVARLNQPVQRLLRKETAWAATEVEGTDVAEVDFREADWPADARLILIRHRLQEKRGRAGGKMLFDCPGYLYQALVTNLPRTVQPLAVWREYNGRAACEGVIKELDAGYGLPQLACQSFWATEAALSFGVLAHNLVVLFERKSAVINKGINSTVGAGLDDIVPVAMELVTLQIDSLHLFVGDSPPCGILPTIEATRDLQTLGRGRLGNEVHDGLVIPQRLTPPVRRDERKESMLDLVPFAGARRKVANGKRKPGFIGQALQLQLPES